MVGSHTLDGTIEEMEYAAKKIGTSDPDTALRTSPEETAVASIL